MVLLNQVHQLAIAVQQITMYIVAYNNTHPLSYSFPKSGGWGLTGCTQGVSWATSFLELSSLPSFCGRWQGPVLPVTVGLRSSIPCHVAPSIGSLRHG